jgi:hypothetical protein
MLTTPFITMHQETCDPHVQLQLQNDLVEHLWTRKGNTPLMCVLIYWNACVNYYFTV